jgi:tRNA-Thr(GGU) m(6)t(6)A37 methyltransferase TsaA
MFKTAMQLILFVILTVFGSDNRHRKENIPVYPVNTMECDSESICFKPIGFFKTPYDRITGAPRHGILKPEVKATIELLDRYEGTLNMLERFEYIIVLYYFDRIKKWSPRFDNLGKQEFGVFATRSPGRPNPIGFAVTKVDSIRRCTLYISGIDAYNNTPVLDIKPYIPSVDVVNSRKNREAEYLFQHQRRKSVKRPARD